MEVVESDFVLCSCPSGLERRRYRGEKKQLLWIGLADKKLLLMRW